MANSPQAIKRARQNKKRALHNHSQRATMRTAIKKMLKAIAAADIAKAKDAFKEAASLLDRLSGRGLVPKNRAARYKSRLNARLKKASS